MKKIANIILSLYLLGMGLLKGIGGFLDIHSCKLDMAQKINEFPEEVFLACAYYRDYIFNSINLAIAIASLSLFFFIFKGKKQTAFFITALVLLFIYSINYFLYTKIL